MQVALRGICKERVQKLLDANFIHPISDKQCGGWWICVDCRDINKSSLKHCFFVSFIDQGLDTIVSKKYFSFLDRLSGYNYIYIMSKY